MKYKPNDIAKALGITTNTIRRYDKLGYLYSQRDDTNYRWYEENDLINAANILWYRKCGFSHSKISEMRQESNSEILLLCEKKMQEMDAELERIKRLRHWLKDNIQLMRRIEELRTDITIRDCVGLKYIIFSTETTIAKSEQLLKTINTFMYSAPEVQLIQLIKYEDLINRKINVHSGWSIKITDVEKFGLTEEITESNPFVKTYPKRKCLYSMLETSNNLDNNANYKKELLDFFNNIFKYMETQNYKLDGDPMLYLVNIFTDIKSIIICIPIADINQDAS